MAWKWVENGSSTKPEAIDTTSSYACVFVRKNFIHVPASVDQEDPENNIPEHWRYEEDNVPREQWDAYYATMVNSANIDYIAMEVGVDL